MMWVRGSRFISICSIVLFFLNSCTINDYDTGDGRYSYLKAEFVEINTDVEGRISTIITDDNETLTLSNLSTPSWITESDATYRALLYYNAKRSGGEQFAISPISLVNPVITNTIGNDTLTLESVWVSKSKKYLNIGFQVKTGTQDGTIQRQNIGLVLDSVSNSSSRVYHLTLAHAQNGVPQYYSVKGYISMPLESLPNGSVFVVRHRGKEIYVTN